MTELILGDALTYLKTLPQASIDLCVTDPPYTALDAHRAIGTTTRLKGAWFLTLEDEAIVEVLSEVYRVLKPNTHCYVFVSYAGVWGLKQLIEENTKFVIPKSLIWDKVSIGMGYNYRSQHEHILFLKKGKRPVNDRGVGDVLRVKRIRGKDTYPTEKPVELFKVLINQSSEKGDLVLDPFCGSGASGVAAVEIKRHYIGVDVGADAISRARAKLFAYM